VHREIKMNPKLNLLFDGYLDVRCLNDDEVAREILKRLQALLSDGVTTVPTSGMAPADPEIPSADNSEPLWEGVEFQGSYYAWAGPLLAMEDRAAVPHTPLLINALEDVGVQASFANPERLPDHLGRGRCQVFATDKKSWRRPVMRGRQFLLAQPPIRPTQ
jgi:hypothetical protein